MLTRILILAALLAVAGERGESPLEAEFVRQRAHLVSLAGSTSEEACSGTGLIVYLQGEHVRHLDWSIEMSTQFIRRQYFFSGSLAGLVIETVHAKLGSEDEPLPAPRLVSVTRYPLDGNSDMAREKEFREHAEFLMHDFRQHRTEFMPVTPNDI
jgi:hypothetical protein